MRGEGRRVPYEPEEYLVELYGSNTVKDSNKTVLLGLQCSRLY